MTEAVQYCAIILCEILLVLFTFLYVCLSACSFILSWCLLLLSPSITSSQVSFGMRSFRFASITCHYDTVSCQLLIVLFSEIDLDKHHNDTRYNAVTVANIAFSIGFPLVSFVLVFGWVCVYVNENMDRNFEQLGSETTKHKVRCSFQFSNSLVILVVVHIYITVVVAVIVVAVIFFCNCRPNNFSVQVRGVVAVMWAAIVGCTMVHVGILSIRELHEIPTNGNAKLIALFIVSR